VAAVTFVLSLGDGLHEYLSERLQAFTPALWVQATEPPDAAGRLLPHAPTSEAESSHDEDHEMARRLAALPGVTRVSKHVLAPVLASAGGRSAAVRLEGYEPAA